MKINLKIISLALLIPMMFVFLSCESVTTATVIPESGGLYNLGSDYNKGWLSKRDLQNISYYLCGIKAYKNFTPSPKKPHELNESIIDQIRQSIWNSYDEYTKIYITQEGYTPLDIGITYGGTYGKWVAILIDEPYFLFPAAVLEYQIEGVRFVYGTPPGAYLWRMS